MGRSQDTAGICPSCEGHGLVGEPCQERVCALRGYHHVPPDAVAAVARDKRDALVGRAMDEYLLVSLLGAGGFGKVYLALQRPIMLPTALKLVHRDGGDERAQAMRLEKFEGEAQALARLSHPHIVRLLKYGVWDGTPYLVMEYVDGGRTLNADLAARALRAEPLDIAAVRHILRQLLDGLEAAHERDIVHRDVKPENVMLQRVAGNPDFVRILDFGLAKFLDDNHDTSVAMGTPRYMAPEQIARRNIGPWTDLYAVGCIAFEMMTGRRAFGGNSAQAVVAAKLSPSYDPVAQIADLDVPDVAAAFFRRALAHAPADRFRTAQEMRDALGATCDALIGERASGMMSIDLTGLLSTTDVLAAHREREALAAERARLVAERAELAAERERLLRAPKPLGTEQTPTVGALSSGTSSAVVAPPPSRRGLWLVAGGAAVAVGVAVAAIALGSGASAPQPSRPEAGSEAAVTTTPAPAAALAVPTDDAPDAAIAGEAGEDAAPSAVAAVGEGEEGGADAVEGDATAAAAAAEEHPPLTPPDDAERADSGLAWVVLTPGNETEAPTGEKDAAVVVLRAWQADGARLTDAEPTPTRVAVDAASPGVREALTMMRPGEARRVWLPASLAPSFGRPEAELLTLELELLTLERAAPEPVVAVAAEETAVAKAPVKKADVPAKKPDTTAKKPDTAATTKTPTPVAKEKTGKELYDEAWELHKRGDLDGALPVYYDAAQHGYPRAYKQLGVLLERRGRPDAALEAYRRYLTALPSAPDADWVRGDIARLSGTAP